MELPLLLCLFGVAVGAPTDDPGTHYDTIVIGLGAAGTTAAAELARAGRRVLALEAQPRVGGRVHTVPRGDGLVELGAEWIHGNESSLTYALAVRHNISTTLTPLVMRSYRSDGSAVDSELVSLLFQLDFLEDPPNPPEPHGNFYTRKLMEYIRKNKPDLLKDQDFITEYLEFSNLATDNLEGSNDWNEVTTGGDYVSLGGPQAISWHRHGYKTFFEIMLNTYNGGPGLPNLDVKLSTEVTRISAPQHPGDRVTVTCRDGSSHVADTAILTVSLGVLKATHSTLFSPPLPKDKQTAVEKISMGVVDKVILTFEEPWWPRNMTVFAFIWKGEDRRRVPAGDYWTTRIFAAHPPAGSSNTLTLWTSGEVAKEVELLSEDTVKAKCVELLQRFMGDTMNVTVPQPTDFIRSNWYSNPFTRGCYTYDNLLTPQYPDARAWLGSPLVDSAGAPRVLFAGEATNLRHFSTVHGAIETGHREAARLLQTNITDKQTAIEKISMGVVDKVILTFEEPWWPRNMTVFAFIWKGEDRRRVPAGDYWTTRIFAAHPPAGSSNTLTLWTSGEVAKEVELLPEDTVKAKCVELLQRFMGDTMNVTVPQPTDFIRSNWYSNPFTRGCYTYHNLLTPQYPDARAWLGSPLVDSAGAPRVLFAGEATNLRHFSTVHGASETGHREAARLLQTNITGNAVPVM